MFISAEWKGCNFEHWKTPNRITPGIMSKVVILSECSFSSLALANILHCSVKDTHSSQKAFSVAWCKNTLEIDLQDIEASVSPVIIVIAHPGSEVNWLLHKTLAMYFSKVIFITEGSESHDGNIYFLDARVGVAQTAEKLNALIMEDNKESEQWDVILGDAFSAKEKKIMMLICKGKNMKEIAKKMGVSIATVYSYRRRICIKAGLKSIQEFIVQLNNSAAQVLSS